MAGNPQSPLPASCMDASRRGPRVVLATPARLERQDQRVSGRRAWPGAGAQCSAGWGGSLGPSSLFCEDRGSSLTPL